MDCWWEVTAIAWAKAFNQKENSTGSSFLPAVVFGFPVPAVSGSLLFFVTCCRPDSFQKLPQGLGGFRDESPSQLAQVSGLHGRRTVVYQFVWFGFEFQLGRCLWKLACKSGEGEQSCATKLPAGTSLVYHWFRGHSCLLRQLAKNTV